MNPFGLGEGSHYRSGSVEMGDEEGLCKASLTNTPQVEKTEDQSGWLRRDLNPVEEVEEENTPWQYLKAHWLLWQTSGPYIGLI